MKNSLALGSWLFIFGSSLFALEAIGEIINSFSPVALIHLAEGLLFLVGSICFLPKPQTKP
ncbi:hypothetical protein [Leptothoe kymatousa]|uniref:Uncharacterized protein n=1 Tax=Leptothoe kymatousa TAU-MAC 1615 TaxID=2364775 RepID=A0ABS5Y0I1_9CYAN|nr:hypothetical protein [Leptothoe kymatousa]MBT9311310.1 hypothetical protein [Leptothoe kymatousa TAU-MAC 1615]